MKKASTIVLITNIPNQYRIPLFNELNKQLNLVNSKLHVIFGGRTYASRKTKVNLSECNFDYSFLESKKWGFISNNESFFTYENLSDILVKINPSKVIVGGFSVPTFKLSIINKLRHIPFYIWSGSINHPTGIRGYIKCLFRKWMITKSAGIMAYSSIAKNYFISLGAEEEKVSNVGNTVDTEFFKINTIEKREQIQTTNSKLKLIYIGYLTKRKGVEELLYVFKEAINLNPDLELEILGTGECEADLKELTNELKLSDKVYYRGFVQKEQLPNYLASSSLFLYQTNHDIWGLVLNETMAAGVPCFASVNAVSSQELIKDGWNGFIVDFKEHKKVAERIVSSLKNKDKLYEIAQNAQDVVSKQYSLAKCAERMIALLEK